MSLLAGGSTRGISIAAPCDGAALSLHAPEETLPWHEHGAAYVCVVLSGSFVESSGAFESRHRMGDIVLHPAGERHADRFDRTGARCLNLQVDANAVVRRDVRRASAGFRARAELLAAQSALGPAGDRLIAESALAEMLDMLFNRESPNKKSAVNRVAEALDDEPHRAWTLVELARIAGRHPTHLARAFREATGISIGEYRRRRRLVELTLSLRCTRDSLANLAQTHGYADQAHMSREFRRFAGSPPGSWRRRLR